MDFFAQQDRARRKTGLLITYFCLAVATTIVLVYLIPTIGWYFYEAHSAPPETPPALIWWHPELFFVVCSITLIVVLTGAAFKIGQLRRGGGESVAAMLGGKQVFPGTDDYFERRLRNVVEEMAIASGVPVPAVFILPKEKGINAFAAGFTPADAVIAVTYGTMTGLTRDELQGVVAHEFSHILNNDIQMNINLMGIIHGLVAIGLAGRVILELTIYSSSGRRRSKDDGGQIVIIAIAAGAALWLVGSCGMLFAKLIKSAISRSRERLADASAIQFTRNPAGLAGALKKIGGLSLGSRLQSPHAEQASHMFFGNGLRTPIFSTHPPLAERVRWLDPSFNGDFPTVTHEDLRKQLARFEDAPLEKKEKKPDMVDLFTDPAKLAITATVLDAVSPPEFRPNNPEALIDSIGAPMEKHTDAARRMIASIPETIQSYARDPYGARMLVYYLLLDSDPEVRDRQMAAVHEQAEPEVARILEKALLEAESIPAELRLPIIDLAIPALRFLAPSQYAAFRDIVKALVDADEQVDVFEYALQRVLISHLDPVFSGRAKPRTSNYYAIRGLEKETSTVLSVLARKGHENAAEAATAFRSAVDKLAEPKAVFEMLPGSDCTWENLDAALDKFGEASFKVKKWLLGAALACLMHDREITVEEVELFRAVADSLGCPVPPWVTPAKL